MYQAFKDMPTLLKFITGNALVCIVFFIAVVTPGISINFNGESMKSQELWAMGLGLPTAAIGLFMPMAGILILKRWHYSRHLYGLLLFTVLAAPYLVSQEPVTLVVGFFISFTIIAYLFINRKVRAYFSS